MIGKMADLFTQNEDALLNGQLNGDLLSLLPQHQCEMIKTINTFSYNNIYNHRAVVEIELSGFHIIGNLLKDFVHAVLHPQEAKSEKLLLLIPKQFPITFSATGKLYENLQSVVDFIAGMTDLFAIDLYRKITGISITK
jgi:dGTPase